MKQYSITHALLLVTWCAIACFVASRYFAERPFRGDTRDIDAFYYGPSNYEFTDELISSSPVWHPANSNPPVSARQALQIAEVFRRNQLPDKGFWKWGLDSLALYPLDGKNGKWCWRILFTAYPEFVDSRHEMSLPPPQLVAWVMMDGTTIQPKTGEYDHLKN